MPLTADQTIAAVIAVTFAAGVMQLLLGVMGMGLLLASLMSWPVMSAFLAGAAIITVASQVGVRRVRVRARVSVRVCVPL